MKEAELKSAAEDYLQYKQNAGELFYLRLNAGNFIMTDEGGTFRRRIKGCPAGTADLLVIQSDLLWDGVHATRIPSVRVIFLELKSEKGKQTKEQKDFQKLVENQGASYFIIRSVEELKEAR